MIESVTGAAFVAGLAVCLGGLAAIVASALGLVDYWPPGERGPKFYLHWALSHSFSLSLFVVGYFDWNSLGLPRPPAFVAGVALFVPGFVVALAAGADLGSEETKGLTGELRTDGWYRYSRNPQYAGYAVATVGFALLANSTLATVLCACYLGWWVSLPFAEEPWLREQYGEEYERYADRVPRFVGRRTVRILAGRANPE